MATTRMAKTSDATWCRAWVCDTTAERTALAATWSSPGGPKRGDEVLDNQDGQLYMFTNGGGMYKISGAAYLPIDLNADVTGILPVANGGTGDSTIAQGDLYYGSAAGVVSRLAKDTNATRYLSNQGTSNNPSYNQVDLTNGVTGILPLLNGGTGVNDFYETGLWTPVIGGSGGTSGQTYSLQLGWFVRIEQLVYVGFNVLLNVKGTITGNVEIQGLPFIGSSVASENAFCTMMFNNTASNLISVNAFQIGGDDTILLFGQSAIGTTSLGAILATADIANNTQFAGVCTYRKDP